MKFQPLAAGFVLLLALTCLPVTAQLSATLPTSQPAEPVVPMRIMPDKVYDVWKAAIESFDFKRGPEDQGKDLTALDQLRKAPWPDFDQIKWVRLTAAAAPENAGVAWCVSQTEGELVLIMPDLSARRIDRKLITKIEPVDPAVQLDGLLKYLKNRKADDKRPWDFTYIEGFGANGFPYYGGAYQIHEAYAAAALGKDAAATELIHEALRQNPVAFDWDLNERAWQSFFHGIQMLDSDWARTDVLAQWEQTLKTYPASRYTEQLADLIAQLKIQVVEEAELARAPAVDPAKLSQAEQIDYYVARLADVHGEQWSQPGSCQTTGMGTGTAISDALVKIGLPAVPALIAQLENRRLTRSIGFWRNFAPDRTVLRYQDVAVECIERILDIRFYTASSTSSYVCNETPEVRNKVIADIKAWWKEHGHETPLQGQMARLELGTIYDRIATLHKIEKLDPKAVDSIATLKRWAEEWREKPEGGNERLIYIADDLARRGDLTMLPEIRRMVHDTEHAPGYEQVWYLLHWGDAEDYRFVLEQSHREIAANQKLDTFSIWGAALGSVESTDNPLAVPLLVEFLSQREMTGSRYRSGYKQSMAFCAADSCIENLIRMTGHDEGYKGDDPPERRFMAIDRWIAWWNKQGQAEYVANHREVGKVLGISVTSAPAATEPAAK